MNRRLLTKLVFSGIRKNKKTIVPFLFVGTVMVMVYYILASLAFGPYLYSDHKEVFYGAQSVAILLEAGSGIIGIFSFIFIFYTNQFVMKDRRREIGLYGILGLSKWNIAAMFVEETILKMGICIGVGIASGTFMNKIMLLVLFKIVNQNPVDGFWISSFAIVRTLILFSVIFFVIMIYNIITVNVGNPVELIRSNKQGEKEPKVNWIIFIIGMVALFFGYFIACQCNTVYEAFENIFASIFLVIVGTYCLFIAGSIFILRQLKKNKKFYYKTRNFISVSNLMYRMKHNAAGLASICVLSTGVILLVTCATTLMTVGKHNLDVMYPRDIMILSNTAETDYEDSYKKMMDEVSKSISIVAKNEIVYSCKTSLWEMCEGGYKFANDMSAGFYNIDMQSVIYILTEENYNKYTGNNIQLHAGEILYADTSDHVYDTLNVEANSYKIVGKTDIKKLSDIADNSMALFNNVYLVVADNKTMEQMTSGDEMSNKEGETTIISGFDINHKLSDKQIEKIEKEILAYSEFATVSFKQKDEALFVTLYGGVFFVGIFLAVIFLLATVIIIYYKQMAEGFEDQNRYQILKQVGLSEKEVRITIKRQVMILFFLPIISALVHMTVASKILRLFLRLLVIVDTFTFNMSIVVVECIFVVVYVIVYKITSAEYYKIVNARENSI